MENTSNQKIITVAFVAAGALAWVVAQIILETLSATVGAVARVADQDMIQHGIPIGIALLLFGILRFRSQSVEWADEVISELKKVVFPSQKDTTGMVIVVVMMLLISSLVLWAFDFLSSQFMRLFV